MSLENRQQSTFLRIFDPSLLAGAISTILFYSIISLPGFRETTLAHYTTEHAVEYVIVALFLWGVCDIVLRLLSFPREFLANRQAWLPAYQNREPVSQASVLLRQIQEQRPWLQNSRMGHRLAEALQFVVEERSAEGLRDRLQVLADQDDDRTHAHYSLTRFIAGVTPILGFLGTVVHFGTALSGISFDEMSARLPVIVAQMGTAFNTTTVALAASMTMMFSVFLCERIERSIILAIDHLAHRDLLNRFEMHDANLLPLIETLNDANSHALQSIDQTLQHQISLWSQALEKLFEKFEERQTAESRAWEEALKKLESRQLSHEAHHEERISHMLTLIDARQADHMDRIQKSLDRVSSISHEIGELTTTLQSVARGEGRLAELQGTLTNNLRVIRETQQLDEALHGLSAAIHLLTARQHQSNRSDSAAA